MSVVSIKYLIECVSYFFISMNITPKSFSRNLLLILNINDKNNLKISKIALENNKKNTKETELITYNSNGDELIKKEEEEIIIKNKNKQMNEDEELLELFNYLLKDQ